MALFAKTLAKTSGCLAPASLLLVSSLAFGQETPATHFPATPATHAEPAVSAQPTHTGIRSAEVRYNDGLLSVSARDSSLNSILGEIARQTGMRISGSVRDDRVFGNYGPDRPSAILSTLLDGTGANMLFVAADAGKPAQLVLTPRTGAPTPPSQFAADKQGQPSQGDGDEVGAAPAQNNRFQQQFGAAPRGANGAPPDQQAGSPLSPPLSAPTNNNSDSQAVVFPSVNATTTPATGTTSSDVTQQEPGGAKTPQQIFEQLQQLRQQQEQTEPGNPPQ